MFCSWVTALRQTLLVKQQRCLVMLNGDSAWANNLVASLLNTRNTQEMSVSSSQMVAYGDEFSADPNLIIHNYRHHLGTENDLVFFADDNFHPDAFSALSGTIKAGGVMFWFCSPSLLNEQNNLFIQRFLKHIAVETQSLVIRQQDNVLPEFAKVFTANTYIKGGKDLYTDCITEDQSVAVKAIEKVASGHRNRPLVLTADRGRGKSSALAIATANLIKTTDPSSPLAIVITAPHLDATKVFFQQLAKSCPQGIVTAQSFTYNNHVVKFLPIDFILLEKPKVQLLLIDEAAAIPIYLLSHLLELYHRLVFSSTVHGYEGAGRGFAINFKKILTKRMPEFTQYHMHEPIRWCENDPLERLIFRSFLLAPIDELPSFLSEELSNEYTCDIKIVSQQQLYENEALLQQVFSVLVTAHYQTSPSDLKFLLTNKQLIIFVGFADDNETVLSVALALNESEASSSDIQLALASKKRLKNQFLPQSLLLHCGIRSAFDYRYLRIVRIAVQPNIQNNGIGSTMLTYIEKYALEQTYDFIGTSFGGNKQLINFWGKTHFQLVRLGFSQDKASGEHSCLLLNSLSLAAESLLLDINQQFYQQFPYYLAEQFQYISPKLVQSIYQLANVNLLPPLSKHHLNVVDDFINKVSLYDMCAYSLSLWLTHMLTENSTVDASLLIAKVLQHHSAKTLCEQYQLAGKKALNKALIEQVKQLVKSTTIVND
ncbi:GNAT family N-acetyltransferase [Thalassotalea piscium]